MNTLLSLTKEARKAVADVRHHLTMISMILAMALFLFSCDLLGLSDSESLGSKLHGTWNVYKAEVVKDGETMTVDVDSRDKAIEYFNQFVFKDEGECKLGYYDFVGNADYDGHAIYRWTVIRGVYSYNDNTIISHCEDAVCRLTYNDDNNTLCGEIRISEKDGTTIKVYLKKISTCYL